MIAYKFLAAGATGLFSRFAWPKPTDLQPGEWVTAAGELRLCLNGIHACRAEELTEWLDDELWEIELGEAVAEVERVLLARRGRLVTRVLAWNEQLATRFADTCVARTTGRAAGALKSAGRAAEADSLLAGAAPAGAARQVVPLPKVLDSHDPRPLEFAADVIYLARGARPEGGRPLDTEPDRHPTPAAIAANLGFVTAHIAGQLAASTGGDYAEAFAAERAVQRSWLIDELGLPPSA